MLRNRKLYLLVAAGLAVFLAGANTVAAQHDSAAVPQTKEFTTHLNGFQEVPSVSSTGSGEFRAKLVDDTTIHYVLQYSGLEGGDTLFAHVHFGQRSVTGGVSFFLCGGGTKPDPCPNVEGTVEGDVTAADVAGPNGQGIEPGAFEEIVRGLRVGHAYANVHTTRWPGGEIRGQINNKDQKEFDK